jgi:hypothetical protein
VLRGAAGVGAVGLAAAAGAGAVFAATRPTDTTRQAGATRPAGAGQAAAAPRANGEPLVVYLRDTSTGEFEVFNGTSQVRLRNPALVAQLLDGLQAAR